MKRLITILFICLLTASCGGGGGGADAVSSVATPLVGVLVDGPVAGVQYQTATQSGITNAQGEFNYLAGETVTFRIGNITLGSATAQKVVTLVNLAVPNADEATYQDILEGTRVNRVTNLARFLLALDEDHDVATDGVITISEAVRDHAGDFYLPTPIAADVFDVNPAVFPNNQDVSDFLTDINTNVDGSVVLVATADADSHLSDSLFAFAPNAVYSVAESSTAPSYVHVEWSFDAALLPGLLGFRLYQDGVQVCDDITPATLQSYDCSAIDINGSMNFTMTAYSLGRETGHSNQLTGNHPPHASVTALSDTLRVVTFDPSGSTDIEGPITYVWDFGDGSTSTSAVSLAHTFSSGVYTVRLTVTDNQGLQSSASLPALTIP